MMLTRVDGGSIVTLVNPGKSMSTEKYSGVSGSNTSSSNMVTLMHILAPGVCRGKEMDSLTGTKSENEIENRV